MTPPKSRLLQAVAEGRRPRYALAGVGGFVAPRHLEAIKATGGVLEAAIDVVDSVGVLDSFDRSTLFFQSFEDFSFWLMDNSVDALVVCVPNWLHMKYIRLGLACGCDVICEKPLVLTPEALDRCVGEEKRARGRIYPILQLRFAAEGLQFPEGEQRDVHVRYVTPRGPWYQRSWKANPEKSGGLVMNIGVHMFDVLNLLFGPLVSIEKASSSETTVAGVCRFQKTRVSWFLSIDPKLAPERTFIVDGEPHDLGGGFNSAHLKAYHRILEGRGFSVEDARAGIEICCRINRMLEGG
jgi:UDP-N-acetyl-2-amino-2-deoxyglucuronate dehydrogenase